jgi:hypothetical protein
LEAAIGSTQPNQPTILEAIRQVCRHMCLHVAADLKLGRKGVGFGGE